MTLQEIKTAVEEGKKVYWKNGSYQVIKDKIGQWLIKHSGGHCIGLTWQDEITMNGEEKDFFIQHFPIFIQDIREGAKFLINSKTWTIDKIEKYKNKQLVNTSYEGGKKGDYRTEIYDLVNYLNEEKAVKL